MGGMLLFVVTAAFSQKTRSEKQREVNELYNTKSMVERFDKSALETDEQIKKQQISNEEKRLQIIMYLDTVPMKEGLRTKLRKDLNENPFSARFQKFMVRYKKEVIITNSGDRLAQQQFSDDY